MGELHKEKLDALVQLGMLLCPEETVGAILEGTQEVLRHIADDVAAAAAGEREEEPQESEPSVHLRSSRERRSIVPAAYLLASTRRRPGGRDRTSLAPLRP